MRKHWLSLLLLGGCVSFASTAMAQDRVIIDTPSGQNSCVIENNSLTNCVPVQRVTIDTPDGKSSCVLLNNSLTDCVPVDNQAANSNQANTDSSNAQLPANRANFIVEPQQNSYPDNNGQQQYYNNSGYDNQQNYNNSGYDNQQNYNNSGYDNQQNYNNSGYDNQQYYNNSGDSNVRQYYNGNDNQQQYQQGAGEYNNNNNIVEYDSSSATTGGNGGYWNNDYGIPNGMTWGLGIGWFGQVADGNLEENGLAVTFDFGYKWTHFALSFDVDMSVSPTEEAFHNIWTYSFSGLFMTFFPLSEGIEQVVGFGIGYTGWTLDYEYTTRSLGYDWWNDAYYVDETNYSTNIDKGGFLSLKLKARLDFVFGDLTMGFEFDWIPWIDTSKSKIVNNIVGIQLHLGGIE